MKGNHWSFATVLLAALGSTMGAAHMLELPVRLHYEPEFYMRVTSTLYRYYGLVGGPIQVLALLGAAALTFYERSNRAFRATLAGTICLAASLGIWFVVVQPVNAAWFDALQTDFETAVRSYSMLRTRWEAGHAAAFVAWVLGFALLLRSAVLRGSPVSESSAS